MNYGKCWRKNQPVAGSWPKFDPALAREDEIEFPSRSMASCAAVLSSRRMRLKMWCVLARRLTKNQRNDRR